MGDNPDILYVSEIAEKSCEGEREKRNKAELQGIVLLVFCSHDIVKLPFGCLLIGTQ